MQLSFLQGQISATGTYMSLISISKDMKSLFNYDSSFLDTSTSDCSDDCSFTDITQGNDKVNRILEAIMSKKYA
jgi:hypothetical protein